MTNKEKIIVTIFAIFFVALVVVAMKLILKESFKTTIIWFLVGSGLTLFMTLVFIPFFKNIIFRK